MPCWPQYGGKQLARPMLIYHQQDNDGFVQERYNSSALAMELHLSCINPST